MARQFETAMIITGDASGGIKAIRATDKELKALNQNFEKGQSRARQFGERSAEAGRELEVLRHGAIGVGAAIAGAFAAGNLRNQAAMIAQTDALAKSLGASTSVLQAWQYAGQQASIDADKMADIFKDVSEKIGEFANSEGGEAADLIENLGLNIRELVRLSPDQQILKIAEALEGVSTASQRANYLEALADDAVLLQPLLEDGAQALRQYVAEAEALGVSMSMLDIENAVAADRAMQTLGATMDGLSNQLVADLGPGLAETADGLKTLIQMAGGLDEVLTGVGQTAVTLGSVYLASRLGKRLATVGATGLTAGRNIAAGLVMATGATGPLNQALVVTQGRLAATAVAGRALNRSMSLLGGPVGVAMVAATALYTFRDELGLTIPKVDASSDAVNQLTGELRDMGREAVENKISTLTADLAALKASAEETGAAYQAVGQQDRGHGGVLGANVGAQVAQIREINAAAQPARQEIANVEEALGLLNDRLTEIDSLGERTPPTLTRIGEASKDAERAAREQAEALEALRQEMDPLRAEHEAYLERIEVLNIALADGTLTQVEYAEAVRWSALQYVDAASGAEAYHERTEALTKEFDRQAQQAQQLEQALVDINARFEAGDIGPEQYGRMVAGVREEMEKLALESDPMAQEMARAWEEAANRIDETFADAFAGAFDGFDDFASQLEDAFKRLLAELAYQATLKPIVVQVTGEMQGMVGGGGSGWGSLAGGGSGGGVNLETVIKGGKTAYDYFFGGGSAGIGSSSTAAVGYGSGWGSSVATGGYTGWAGSAAAGSNMAGAGSSFGGGAMTGLYTAGAAYAGGYVGSAIGGLISDKQANSNYGQMVGTAIGTAILPGIGSGIGAAIGSLADTLFGSGGSDLDIAMMRRESSQGYRWDHGIKAEGGLGTVGFDDDGSHEVADLWDVEEAKQLVNSIAQLDTLVASLASNEKELADMRAAAQGHYGETSDPNDVVGRLTSRYDEVFAQLDGDFGTFVRSLKGGVEEIVPKALQARDALAVMSDAAGALNLTFNASGVKAYEASLQMSTLAGGVENLAAIQQGYYQSMFTEAERLSRSQETLIDQFKETFSRAPETTAEYRELVEAQDLNTEAGRRYALELMKLAPAYEQNQQAIKRQLAETYEEALGGAASQQAIDHWSGKVMTGALTLSQALDKINAITDGGTSALDELLSGDGFFFEGTLNELANGSSGARHAVMDLTEALRTQETMEQQLLQLSGDQEALREKQLAELREIDGWQGDANRENLVTLQRRIWAQEEANAKEEAAAQLAEQRAAMEIRLLEAQGRASAVIEAQRAAELKQLDASLRPLQERIWALQDEAEAEAALAEIAQQRVTLNQQILSVVDSEAALAYQRERELEAIDDSLRPLQRRLYALQDEQKALEQANATLAEAEGQLSQVWQSFDQTAMGQQIALMELAGDKEAVIALQRERELASLEASLRPFQERIWALQDEAQAQEEAAAAGRQYADALANAQEWLDGALGSISDWIDGQAATAGTPETNLGAAREQFDEQLALARAGDRDALQGITRYADQLLTNAEAMFASGPEAQAERERVLAALEGLPDAVSAEQYIADEVRQALEDTIGDLPLGIASALSPMFDSIDLDADGLIDYDEFARFFDGIASDETLETIYRQLDADGSGTIDALEAVKGSTDDVGDNTGDLKERSHEQLEKLTNLVEEMTRTTDQFVDLNVTMGSLSASIHALGVAQEEQARIEKERLEAEQAERERIEAERKKAEKIAALEKSASSHLGAYQDYEDKAQEAVMSSSTKYAIGQGRVNDLMGVIRNIAGDDNLLSDDEMRRVKDYATERRDKGVWTNRDRTFVYQAANAAYQQSEYLQNMREAAELKGGSFSGSMDWNYLGYEQYLASITRDADDRARLYIERYSDLKRMWQTQADMVRDSGAETMEDWARYHYNKFGKSEGRVFAKGGVFTNGVVDQPTLFDMGLMGEAGPEAIMPLASGPEGLGVRIYGPSVAPQAPLLGGDDVLETLRDMRRELSELRKENRQMKDELARHGAASVAVAQEGFKRLDRNTGRIAETNESIDDRQRLEAAR